jgi:hypothetical protein
VDRTFFGLIKQPFSGITGTSPPIVQPAHLNHPFFGRYLAQHAVRGGQAASGRGRAARLIGSQGVNGNPRFDMNGGLWMGVVLDGRGDRRR